MAGSETWSFIPVPAPYGTRPTLFHKLIDTNELIFLSQENPSKKQQLLLHFFPEKIEARIDEKWVKQITKGSIAGVLSSEAF